MGAALEEIKKLLPVILVIVSSKLYLKSNIRLIILITINLSFKYLPHIIMS